MPACTDRADVLPRDDQAQDAQDNGADVPRLLQADGVQKHQHELLDTSAAAKTLAVEDGMHPARGGAPSTRTPDRDGSSEPSTKTAAGRHARPAGRHESQLRAADERLAEPRAKLGGGDDTPAGRREEVRAENAAAPVDDAAARARRKEDVLNTHRAAIAALEAEKEQLTTKIANISSQLRSPHPPAETVARHIRALHDYNAVRDVGLGLMGLIADARGVRCVEVLREFGVDEGD